MGVDDLQSAAIFGRNGRGHLQVFLTRTVPFLLFLGANLDVETVGMKPQMGKLPNDDTAVDTPRQQHGNALLTKFIDGEPVYLVFFGYHHGCKVTKRKEYKAFFSLLFLFCTQ